MWFQNYDKDQDWQYPWEVSGKDCPDNPRDKDGGKIKEEADNEEKRPETKAIKASSQEEQCLAGLENMTIYKTAILENKVVMEPMSRDLEKMKIEDDQIQEN